ncbi:MAG: MAPEG family protein [Rhodobiaceae bacterium]|nr:MAPEG family protein [Rhodobiaceae bacterium]
MTLELWILLATLALALFITSVPLFRAMRQQWGFKAMLGARDDVPPLTGWGGRVVRAYANLMDNLVYFAVVVLTAHVVGVSNEMTALGALIFFVCRVAHAFFYIAGVSVLRTVAYLGGVGGIGLVAAQLF